MKIDRVKLAMIMAKERINITELSKKARVSRATISYAKAGRTVSIEMAAKLAVALNVGLDEIIDKTAQEQEKTV